MIVCPHFTSPLLLILSPLILLCDKCSDNAAAIISQALTKVCYFPLALLLTFAFMVANLVMGPLAYFSAISQLYSLNPYQMVHDPRRQHE